MFYTVGRPFADLMVGVCEWESRQLQKMVVCMDTGLQKQLLNPFRILHSVLQIKSLHYI